MTEQPSEHPIGMHRPADHVPFSAQYEVPRSTPLAAIIIALIEHSGLSITRVL